MADPILTQSTITCNGRPLTVRTRCPIRANITGLVLPAGRVLAYNPQTNQLIIDFGVSRYVQAIPLGRSTIERLAGESR